MSEAPSDQPVVDAPTAGADTGVVTEAPATNEDIDTEAFDRMAAPDDDAGAGDGQPGDDDPPSGDSDEIEFEVEDGKTLKVPKALEPHILRAKDYTQKTQVLADERRTVATEREALATERAQQAESLKEYRSEHIAIGRAEAEIATIDGQLAEYRKLTAADWQKLRQDDPANYTAHADNYDFLKRTRDASEDALKAAKTDLAAKEDGLTKRQQEAQQGALAKAWQQTDSTLAKEIDGWTPPWQPGKGKAIMDFAVKELGYTAEELREATDPRAWKMANALMEARAKIAKLETGQQQRAATETALKPQVVTPAVKSAGGGARPTGVKDHSDIKSWMASRNTQVARKRA